MGKIIRSGEGFSLIELLMVVITVGIISVVVAPIFTAGFQSFFKVRNVAGMTAEGELAMERMARELRAIDPSADFDSTALPGASQIKFLQYNGTAQAAWVTYSLSGTDLKRNNDLLAASVSSLNFSYYNRSGVVMTPPLSVQANSIWLVQIVMQLASREGNETLRSTIFLRSGPVSR